MLLEGNGKKVKGGEGQKGNKEVRKKARRKGRKQKEEGGQGDRREVSDRKEGMGGEKFPAFQFKST